MTISNYDSLQKWFLAPKGAEPAPFWNLYGLNYGRTDQVVHRNVEITDMQESARQLEEVVKMLSPDGEVTRFKLTVYPAGKANNPTASVEIQMRNTGATHTAGIAGLPPGVGSMEQYINQRVEAEKLRWEIDALKEQLNTPAAGWERVLDTISGVPGIDKVLQAIVMGLVSRFNPASLPAIQQAINGTPDAMGAHNADNEDPDEVFSENIAAAAQTLNTDPVTLAKKLNVLVKQNPELAKTLLQ